MANGYVLASYLKKLPFLLVCGVPLLALIAFSDANVYWVKDAYDGWRIFQIIVLMILGCYAVFTRVNNTVLSPQTSKTLTMTLLVIFGLVVATISQSEHSARAAADAALYALLAMSIWSQADLFRKNQAAAAHIAALLALLPLFVVWILFTSLYLAIDGKTLNDWHQSFANIRMLDDALLPCLFLLWQRPAWLQKNTSQNPFISTGITSAIYVISTAYFLILWYDGARAVLISIIVGLGFVAIFRRDYRPNLRLPLLTLLGAGLLFLTLKHIISPNFLANPILRSGSSGRDDLWLKTLQLWYEHPILGVGGNNFVTSNPWLLNGHPHNLPLQWISEWGIAGLLTMLLLIPLGFIFFRHRRILPAFALGAVVAVGVDALFSGVLVYPLSQMLGVWSFAWLVSLLPTYPLDSNTSTHPHFFVKMTAQRPLISWHFMLKMIALIALLVMLTVHGRDMICSHCMSTDNDNAPRFWQYGRALHLVPIGSEAINNAPHALLKNR